MILEPEAYQQAEDEFHRLHRGPYRDEEVTRWIFFSLMVKELRQQNELFKAIEERLESIDDTLITMMNPDGRGKKL